MRTFWIAMLLVGTLAWSQTKPAAPASTSEKARAKTAKGDDDDDKQPSVTQSGGKISSNTPVLTIEGLCNSSAAKGPAKGTAKSRSECQTIVTRAQFEKLVLTLMPANSPQSKRQFATTYPRLLVMAKEARARGLDKTARFEEIVNFARLQILSQELVRELKEDASKVSDKEIEDYYRQNTASFERATVERIVVPLRRQLRSSGSNPNAGDPAVQIKEGEEAMRKKADDLHTRAVAGEDFDKLQKEGYEAAGIANTSPMTAMDKLRRTQLPGAHGSVFDLKVGEISPVIKDASGYYIYKVRSRDQEPEQEATAEIRSTLEQQHMREMMDKIDHSFKTNENQAYFGSEKPRTEEDND